jgi:hypothetical protein
MFSILEREHRAPSAQMRSVNAHDHFQNGARFVNACRWLPAGFDSSNKILDKPLVVRVLSAQA